MKRILRLILLAALIVLFGGIGWLFRSYAVGTMRVQGTSMNPTLQNGDLVLISRAAYRTGAQPQRGDIVECTFPGREGTYIKRVVGLPGESISFSDGELFIDGLKCEEPYVSGNNEDYDIKLEAGQYLVLGDNRPESYDSRMEDIGPVGEDTLKGKVVWVLWPLSRVGKP